MRSVGANVKILELKKEPTPHIVVVARAPFRPHNHHQKTLCFRNLCERIVRIIVPTLRFTG